MAEQGGQDARPSDPDGRGRGKATVGGGQVLAGHDVFRAAVQVAAMPMCLADPTQPDMPLVFVNRAFCELTGYAEGEILGRNCRFLQGPATSAADVARVRAAAAAAASLDVELYNYRKDGTGFWNALHLRPVFDGAGTLIYMFGSQTDVSCRREADGVLDRSRRLEVLGGMAGSLAHDFNNLLTVVLANLEPLERRADERDLRRLARIDDAVRRTARLTQQVLSFARRRRDPASAAAAPVDLRDALLGVDGLIGQAAGAGVRVRLDVPDTPLCARLDAGRFEVALFSLVGAVRDAMPAGGELTVLLRRVPMDGTDLGWAELEVRGIGRGPAAPQSSAAPPRDGGAGPGRAAGLAVADGLVMGMGGTLQVEGSLGQGAIFIRFPAAEARGTPGQVPAAVPTGG